MYFDFEKFESYEEFVERINERIYTFILDEKEFDDKKLEAYKIVLHLQSCVQDFGCSTG